MDTTSLTHNTMFSSTSNAVFTGGTFTQHNGPSSVKVDSAKELGGFERLLEVVAPAAFHNSEQRADTPKCHPNTRIAVLQKIIDWIQNSEDRDAWIMWLHGAAGAGKSAITQSITELCVNSKLAIASFFFFRTDPTRNSAHPLVATLAYQLCRTSSAAREIITRAIEKDPLVFQQSFKSQLESLIIEPLRQLKRISDVSTDLTFPLLIVIDGLDECEGRDVQTSIIYAISDALRDKDLPVLFLIASRPEQHLTMAFSSRKVADILTRLPLDDTYFPDKDIRLFLNDKFAEIKIGHPFRHLIDPSWPAADVLESLVEKSSGQFIYASVVMNFVSSSRHHPVQRLEVIQGIRLVGVLETPFAQLDALYMHIFSCVEDIKLATLILSFALLGRATRRLYIEKFLALAEGDVEIALADLPSVVVLESDTIKFLHASLPDFLLDPARSQNYYIDPPNAHADFAHRWFEHSKARRLMSIFYYTASPIMMLSAPSDQVVRHLDAAAPTNELHQDILEFVPRPEYFIALGSETAFSPVTAPKMSKFLSSIKALDFGDEHRAYNYQLEMMTRMAKKKYPDSFRELGRDHDISKILIKLEEEGIFKKWPLRRLLEKVFNM
ncbi:hypothetical protein BDZ97DRAFT_144833 [Flammula alnicola]|nr:hypothetical protein BDZ97DRAFT_144833 [Flammula alnicola]